MRGMPLLALLLSLVLVPGAMGMAAVSQMGYHTDATKQVTVYTSQASGTYSVRNLETNTVVYKGSLAKAVDYHGSTVQCQGNNPCLVADFTRFKTPGTYRVEALGFTSPTFVIATTVFEDHAPVFLEFFDALLQQNSSYHEDLHGYASPAFSIKADGSFIMEAHQASVTLMRLGRAYRENPGLWDIDVYSPVRTNTPDMLEHIVVYADYLKGLHGVQIEERTDGVGFRLDPSLKIHNAFVPGPTTRTELEVFIPGSPPTHLETVEVVSLCAPHDSSARWNTCIEDAALYYKCQINEPCLNMSYIERTGVLVSNNNGYGVSRGWGYEFGCYQDIDLHTEMYGDKHNPCAIFYPEVTQANTIKAMTAWLYAIPALNDYDENVAYDYLLRAYATYTHLNTPDAIHFAPRAEEAGYYGAGLFLMYEYTGDVTFLQQAHELRNTVSQQLVSDRTRGEDMYWHEYARNKDAMLANGLEYPVSGQTPEDLLRGKMYFDYKDRGSLSIGRNAERVYELDRNIQFQNSRYMLKEGLYALQTLDLHPNPEPFIKVIADAQIAWLTGKNGVQAGVQSGSPIRSYSFIFGIGNNPQEFHSRYLVNTGYTAQSNGRITGARSTGYQFYDDTVSEYYYLDAKFTILGQQFGSFGNRWGGEVYNDPFNAGTVFANGKTQIPGWINGAFDTASDTDIIFNYYDSQSTFEFTESTNEMVSLAMEYFSLSDRLYNNRAAHPGVWFNITGAPPIQPPEEPEDPEDPPEDPEDPACYTSVSQIPAFCSGGTITTETPLAGVGKNVICSSGGNSLEITAWDKNNNQFFEMYKQQESGHGIEICLAGSCIRTSGTGFVKSDTFPICTNETPTEPEEPEPPAPEDPDPPGDDPYCATSISELDATCVGGTITEDTISGCRRVVCEGTGTKLEVLACDKPGSHNPTYVEVYMQSVTGSPIAICFSGVCLDPRISGFVRADYPVCDPTQPPPSTDDPEDPSPGDLDNVKISIAPWYPQERDYIFVCDGGSTATEYDYRFGDGNMQLGTERSDVYHRYALAGDYTVSCTARNATHQGSATMSITVI